MNTIQDFNYFHIIGYTAATLLIISFVYKPQHRIMRFINSLGSFLFILYGATLKNGDGLPIIVANATILLIHIFYYVAHKQNDKNINSNDPNTKNTI